MTQDAPMEDPVLKAALRVIAVSGWTRASFAQVAEEANQPLAEVLSRFPTRAALLCAWGRHIDAAMLKDGLDIDPRETPRDRLFDLIMRRLDALLPDKEAIRALLPGFAGDPHMAMAVAMGLSRSMALTLEAAGLSSAGPAGALRAKGLGLVYASTVRVWLKDDSPDMAKTMAALDKALDRADAVANTLFGGGRWMAGRDGDGAESPRESGLETDATFADPA